MSSISTDPYADTMFRQPRLIKPDEETFFKKELKTKNEESKVDRGSIMSYWTQKYDLDKLPRIDTYAESVRRNENQVLTNAFLSNLGTVGMRQELKDAAEWKTKNDKTRAFFARYSKMGLSQAQMELLYTQSRTEDKLRRNSCQ